METKENAIDKRNIWHQMHSQQMANVLLSPLVDKSPLGMQHRDPTRGYLETQGPEWALLTGMEKWVFLA